MPRTCPLMLTVHPTHDDCPSPIPSTEQTGHQCGLQIACQTSAPRPLVFTPEIFQRPEDRFRFSEVVVLMNCIFTLQSGKNTREKRHPLLYGRTGHDVWRWIYIYQSTPSICLVHALIQQQQVAHSEQLCRFRSFLQTSLP